MISNYFILRSLSVLQTLCKRLGLHHIRKVCQDFAGGKEVGEVGMLIDKIFSTSWKRHVWPHDITELEAM